MSYTWLTSATKKRVIRELRKILEKHPRYRSSAQNVQDKYSFDERPQRGIIINSTSADRVRLSADNYIGRMISFVQLAKVGDAPSTTIEWVRENQGHLEEISPKRNIFPTQSGVYVVEVLKIPDEPGNVPGQFTIDPILTIINEPLITFSTSDDNDAQLSNVNIYPGSVRLWLDQKRMLVENVDYIVDVETGLIQFLKETPTGGIIFADYRYITPKLGPFNFRFEEFNVTALPGVVIAFGDRAEKCDKQAIVITDERTETAEIYGGKFEVALELLVFTRDSEDRNKMADFVITEFLNIQNMLGFEGIELIDISPGGEVEEIYNETDDSYYYDTPISLSLRVDWETHVPLPINIDRIEMTSKAIEDERGYLDGSAIIDLIRVGSMSQIIGHYTSIGKGISYERIL